MLKIKDNKLLVYSIIASQLAGILGSAFTRDSIDSWYRYLEKPSFNPPNWLFGPVWVILYTLMGISVYIVWVKKGFGREVKLFLWHLLINTLWSIIFFGAKEILLALIVIIILWIFIFYLIKLFYPINRRASYLLIPYLLWVSFASILNLSIYILNR